MPRPSRKTEILKFLPEAEVTTWTKAKRGKRGTVADLIRLTGLTSMPIGRYLNTLYDDGLAHIGCWNRTRKAPAAVWVQGKGEHAPRPDPLPKQIVRRRYVKNRATAIARGRAGKSYDQRYSRFVASAIADDTVARTSVAPVSWASALGI